MTLSDAPKIKDKIVKSVKKINRKQSSYRFLT